ncbi:Sterol 3-beta-glucosyltransferase [Phytophthora cinnamomi]|uniref:Sterol 3-beta-glucosyltransferase n=1 Tax=Phytophthora cinnamomi TaxID=4785 RepID=UPI00355A9249|nr:Sterol 3-beta-glucosyltransferase [Phytophthora cinnamomi]KAG6616473.1 Sterol 3-beta-glucosyltransferase [Phytophthora cinnamomi]
MIWPYADIQFGFLDRELGFDHLHALAAQGRHRAVRKLLRKGMDPNARRLEGAFGADDDERGDSPMICAARGVLGNKDQPRHLKTLELLLHFGGKVNQPNLLNQTALYIACERNVMHVATWLLQHGADVNINCKTGVSPLMCAYQNENAKLATMLLEKGAVVIRPPATFSHVKFPELADELEVADAPVDDKNAATLHSTLQQYIDREAAHRARLIEAANEAQRLEDQRVYREQLARDGAKRKARRRRQRLEAQQRRNLPPLKALGAATNTSDIDRDEEQHSPSQTNNLSNQGEALLLWEKKVVVPRPRTVLSSDRPQWVARQIHCTQQSQTHRTESEHDFMRQCTKLYDSLEQERSRRLSIRNIVTAPANPGRGPDRHGLVPCDVRPETASF